MIRSDKRFKKVYIEITNVCNLKCDFCPEVGRDKSFIEVEDFRKIIDEIKPYTNLIYLHIKGEPLLHPDLEEVLKICEENNIQINITTNATLLLEKVNILKEVRSIRQINLSLHSALQNKGTDVEKYLNNVIKAVKILHESTDILISFRLWNFNNPNAKNVNQSIVEVLGKEYKFKNLLDKSLSTQAIKLDKRTYLNQDVEFTWPSLKLDVISETGKCFGLRNQIGILVNGDIVPCCLDQEGDIKLGNIYENSIEEILESEKAKEIIIGFEKHKLVHPLCKRCGFRTRFDNKEKGSKL